MENTKGVPKVLPELFRLQVLLRGEQRNDQGSRDQVGCQRSLPGGMVIKSAASASSPMPEKLRNAMENDPFCILS